MTTRVFFFGTPEIAVPALRTLVADNAIEVVGVGTPPAKPVGRKRVITPCQTRAVAEDLGLPVHDVSDRTGVAKIYAKHTFDLAVVIAFGVIFPADVLEKIPTLNVHFSLLPKYRGASPVQAAILAGDKISGITVQKMVAELDAGPIVWATQELMNERTTAQLWSDWANTTAEQLPEIIKNYDESVLEPQDETFATHCGKFSKSDGEIVPSRETSEQVWRKFRAFDPWPGIWMQSSRGVVKILKCSLKKTPGSVALPCKNSEIYLEKIQLAGKSAAPAADVLRGAPDLLDR